MDQITLWNARYSGDNGAPEKDRWIEQFICYIGERRERTVVDLGCGKGANSLYLSELGYNVIACDFSPAAIEYIKKENPHIKTGCFDMLTEFPDTVADAGVVIASLSTHYFTLEDTIKLYGNIHAALVADGYFLFRVNSKKELEDNDSPHVARIIEPDYYELKDGATKRYFDTASIGALLQGFSIIRLNESSAEYHGKKKHYIEVAARKL